MQLIVTFLHIACHFRNLFVFLHNNRYWVNMTNIRKYMAITKKINANGTEISILLQGNENDYICLTDMARYKDKQRTDYIIQNWLRSRSTIEYLGVWEQLHNPNFNPIEFDGFRNQAELKGNIRDYATINELICLSNMENINAVLINDGMPQGERLVKLNQIAIQQMQVLEGNSGRNLLK